MFGKQFRLNLYESGPKTQVQRMLNVGTHVCQEFMDALIYKQSFRRAIIIIIKTLVELQWATKIVDTLCSHSSFHCILITIC